MSNAKYVFTLIIITLSPFLFASLNGGVIPVWMHVLAIIGLVLGGIVAFQPARKDAGK